MQIVKSLLVRMIKIVKKEIKTPQANLAPKIKVEKKEEKKEAVVSPSLLNKTITPQNDKEEEWESF